jgi:D-psicose/D-tagatose/L-ribulose 3-epimerase
VKLTLCSEVLRELDIARQFAMAAALGYDGIEIAPFTLDSEPQKLSTRRVAEIRRAASDAGISITGLHWLLVAPEGMSITSEDAETRQFTLRTVQRLVELCAELGGGYVVHGSPAQRRLAPGREEEDRANAMIYFENIAMIAEKSGITYLLEPLAPDLTNFVTSVAEANRIVETIKSPAFLTMIDCSAAGVGEEEDVPALLRRWLPTGRIVHIHFNDPNRRGPGEGAMDFAPIVAALAECGYEGWVGVEPFVYEPDGPTCAARSIGYVRGIERALSLADGGGHARPKRTTR